MNEIFKIVLSLSVSGSLLILFFLLCKPLIKNRMSKRWQYYIWLVVIARLLLPLTPEISPVGTLFRAVDRVIVQAHTVSAPEQSAAPVLQSGHGETDDGTALQGRGTSTKFTIPIQNGLIANLQNAWLVWLVVALILMIRKITVYQGFVRYIKVGRIEVSDTVLLDRLAKIGEQVGVKTPVELYTNSLISSPLLLGFVRPCIVLPTVDLPDADFQNTILHELTHYKRRDMFYKWLVQLTVCLHWFNPLAYLMSRDVNRACELACDETIIKDLSQKEQRAYGDTLLNSMGAGGSYKDALASVTLNESKELLKERLESIMRFQGNKKADIMIAILLAICLFAGGFFLGAYSAKPDWEGTTSGQMTEEGLPVMSAKNRNLYETYVAPIMVTGLLTYSFSPEDVSSLLGNNGSTLMYVLDALEQEQVKEFDGAVPERFAEEVLLSKLPLQAWNIKDACAAIYDETTGTYTYSSGLGGGPAVAIVTESREDSKKITLRYTWYLGDPSADQFQYKPGNSGELIIEVGDNDFKYTSNKVISTEDAIKK